jgi:hypothetical protein
VVQVPAPVATGAVEEPVIIVPKKISSARAVVAVAVDVHVPPAAKLFVTVLSGTMAPATS